MSKKDCPTGTCPWVNNDDAKSDAGSEATGRSGRSGKSDRSGRSDKSDRSGKSDKSDRSGKSDKSDRTGKSDKSDRSGKSDKSHRSGESGKSGGSHKSGGSGKKDGAAGSVAGSTKQPSSVYSGKESMMNDGESQSGSVAGSDPAPAPRKRDPKKPAKQVTFGATGHIDGENVGMVCKRCSCGRSKCVKCKTIE